MELIEHSAIDLAAQIAAGTTSSVDLVTASLARIATVQPRLNPFAFVFPEQALAQARAADAAVRRGDALGPLHGLPVAFKDFTPTLGHRTTRGSHAYEHAVADADPVIVRRFKAAGAIILGKTTTPEFAHSGFTRSPLWGHTRNPWDPNATSGGSSGGSGVAVATACVALAEGTDMGGSVRIPAACCGVVGLKPSLGRIPMDILSTSFDDMSHFGPLARTVSDAALFLQVAEGPDDADISSQVAPLPVGPLTGDLRGLRLAVSPDLGFYAVSDAARAGLDASVDALREAGAQVEPVALAWDASMVEAWMDWWGVYLAAGFGHVLPEYRARMDPDLVALMEAGLAMGAVAFKRIEAVRTRAWALLAQVFARHDALICPTMTQVAAPFDSDESQFMRRDADGRLMAFDMTSPFNMVAQCPALSVPCGFSDGLPLGVQIVARRFQDGTALQIGRALEQRRPWPIWRP